MLFVYIMWPHWKENLLLLWYLGNVNPIQFYEGIKCFCEIFRTQNHTLYTLRLVSLWGCPEHILLPNTLHTFQETAIQPREATLQPRDFSRPPYGPRTSGSHPTAMRLPLQSPPAYPSFRQSIPMVPSIHSLQESPRGHTDYKTTRLHCQPTESIMPRWGKIQKKA